MANHTSSAAILSVISKELHSILSALIGGAKYGIKIRLPHALLMTFMFRHDLSASDKLRRVLQLSFEHASSLAAFATLYKVMLASLKLLSKYVGESDAVSRSFGRILLSTIVHGPFPGETTLLQRATTPAGYPERAHHALIAGAVGGFFVWGRYTAVNNQVVLYLASRVLVGLWKRLLLKGRDNPHPHPKTYPILASVVWGIVMMLFEESPQVLHPSLKNSMDEIYRFRLLSSAGGGHEDSNISHRSKKSSSLHSSLSASLS